ncbi:MULTISPECIES: hypothetical protein [Microbispora]|uniref:Uncharacterized protein n=1 Tax=Microbispora siamensis TaxID=564413 RepID=A0ABQ4GP06_9ACTN|nr:MULTISPECIES: hypothetical protein [Microbispora]MBE3011532.1 hypothetical protein [Microbispora sitophila]GIH63176.1 hypothetical protein Msi02_39930 [Microbispora siamensis]
MDATSYGPGLLGFLVVAAIGLALFFLLKNMNKQMRKIQVPHDEREDERRGNGPEA